jgi:hypothetical protein
VRGLRAGTPEGWSIRPEVQGEEADRAGDNHGGQCSGSVKVAVPIQQGGSSRDDGPHYDSTAQ